MSGQHTPGPWLVEDPLGNGPGDAVWIVQEGASSEVYDWRNIAVVCSDDPDDSINALPITVAERDANARLIAAAPDYASASDKLVAWADRAMPSTDEAMDYLNDDGWEDLAVIVSEFHAAIAKARGAA